MWHRINKCKEIFVSILLFDGFLQLLLLYNNINGVATTYLFK